MKETHKDKKKTETNEYRKPIVFTYCCFYCNEFSFSIFNQYFMMAINVNVCLSTLKIDNHNRRQITENSLINN